MVYLSLTQSVNMLFPILIYAYFLKVIGTEIYGELLIYQAVVAYFSLIVNYGFNISGVKKVVDCNGDFNKISFVFSSIFYIKSILFCIILFLIFVYCLFSSSINPQLLFLCSLVLIYEWLFPQWFFQAMDKLKLVFFLSALSKIVSMILLLIFLKRPADYFLIPLFMGISSSFIGVFSLALSYKLGVRFFRISVRQLLMDFKDSSFLFLSTFLLNIKARADIFFVGLLIGLQQVVYFDFIIKILGVALIPIGIINNAFYARSSSLKDKYLFRNIIFLSLIVGFFMCLMVFFGGDYLIEYVKLNSDILSPLVSLISICIFVLSVSVILELNGLIAWGYKKTVFIGAFLNLGLYLVGIYVLMHKSEVSLFDFVILTIFLHLFDIVFRIVACIKYKVFHFYQDKSINV
nr:oligosaccharide flippase family protein [Thorsellia anophelis]